MLIYNDPRRRQTVSVLFHNQLSQDISHVILDENEDVFQQLVQGSFQTKRDGKDVFVEITSETELLYLRQITKMPIFIKF